MRNSKVMLLSKFLYPELQNFKRSTDKEINCQYDNYIGLLFPASNLLLNYYAPISPFMFVNSLLLTEKPESTAGCDIEETQDTKYTVFLKI